MSSWFHDVTSRLSSHWIRDKGTKDFVIMILLLFFSCNKFFSSCSIPGIFKSPSLLNMHFGTCQFDNIAKYSFFARTNLTI